jgi:hypothetical protein
MYGNYVTSFGANNGVSSNNQPFPPQTGKQQEAGFKADLFEHRLNATLAFYHLTRNNLVTPDLASGDPLARIVVGEQRSQGIEFDMTGRVTNAVSVIGSYAYTDTKVTKDNSGLQEKRLPGVPLHGGSLWMKYDFAELERAGEGAERGIRDLHLRIAARRHSKHVHPAGLCAAGRVCRVPVDDRADAGDCAGDRSQPAESRVLRKCRSEFERRPAQRRLSGRAHDGVRVVAP